MRPRASLTKRRVVRAAVLCGVVAVLAVAHVQLRFVTADLRQQELHLQRQAEDLRRHTDDLEQGLARMSSLSHIEDFARHDLGMIASDDAMMRAPVEVPRHIAAKYATGAGATDAPAADGQPAVRAAAFDGLEEGRGFLATLLDFNRAFAAVVTGREKARETPELPHLMAVPGLPMPAPADEPDILPMGE